MLVIRLSRVGRNKYPTYRVVAADSRRPANGKFVSILGHFNPHTKELVLKKEEIIHYIENGAQPSNSMIRLLDKEKVKLPEWAKYHAKNKASKQEAEKAPVAAAQAAESAPTEEVATPEEAPADATENVAATAADQAAETAESVPDKNTTETAETAEKQEQAAEKAEDIAAEAAVEAPAEPE